MDPTTQVRDRNKSFNFYLPFRFTTGYLAALALLTSVLTWSCGGGTSASGIRVSLSPSTAQVALRGQIQFTAAVSGGTSGITWSVNGAPGGSLSLGTINSTGLYIAPNSLPAPNTVTVAATSVAEPTQAATASVTLVNPAPVVSSISPAAVNEGSGNTTLTVTGTGFCAQSVVELGSTALATLFVNPTVLTAVVPAAQLANVGNLAVAVTTPAPGGGTSSPLTLAVLLVNPAPTISSISPATVFALSGATLLTVTGAGFIPQSTLSVNGSAFPATVVSSTELTASISSLMVAQPAAFNLVVSNPAPGGGTSAAATFTVLAPGSVTPTGNPQVALYSFSSPRDASVSIEFGTDTTYGLSTWALNTPPGGGAVQILVAGMKANTTYHMRADVSFPDGTQFFDADHTFATGGLISPLVAPQITITNPNGLTPSPGAILLDLILGTSSNVQVGAVDNAGNLIWYYNYDSSLLGFPEPIKPLPNGHMLINFGTATPAGVTTGGTVQEIDLAGNLISQFTLADLNNWLSAAGYNLNLASIHHDILPLPNGHLILVVNHDVECTSIPGCVGTDDVIVDALVDLDANHNPVWVWDEADQLCPPTPTGPCLDINRRPLGFPDWTHANSLFYSPDDGNLILSMRNQSWVVKIDYQDGLGSGAILWRLGYQGDFTLTNGTSPDWFYAQHYANVVSPNSTGVFQLMVFDDGDNRVLDAQGDVCGASGEPACYSTVPIFQVDEANMTATLLWQDNLSPVYSYFAGSAQQLSDNNVVMGINVPSDAPKDSRYMEVTHDPSPLIVLRMEVVDQEAYRMVHIPSLYPGVQW